MTKLKNSQELNTLVATLWLWALLLLGMAPSVGFFFWVERNCTLPWLPLQLGWPWVDGTTWLLILKLLWNAGLFGIFGFLHSALAHPGVQAHRMNWIPAQAQRAFYLIVTGVSLFAVSAFWQNTGIIVWSLPISPQLTLILSPLLFWTLLLIGTSFLVGHDFWAFFGFKPLYQSLSQVRVSPSGAVLITTGMYAVIRHPVYLFTLASMIVTPVLSLDRLWLFSITASYLAFAIPHEEAKLIRIFGEAYLRYRERVPAVVPFWKSGRFKLG